jgi:hypothetical protein
MLRGAPIFVARETNLEGDDLVRPPDAGSATRGGHGGRRRSENRRGQATRAMRNGTVEGCRVGVMRLPVGSSCRIRVQSGLRRSRADAGQIAASLSTPPEN